MNYDIRFVYHANQDQSRIDASGALHHIIARGIERKRIFTDGIDRNNFLNRLGNILTQTAYFPGILRPFVKPFVKPFTCILFRDTLFSSFNHLGYLLSLGLMFRKPIIIGNPDGFSIIRQVCVQNSGNNIIMLVKGS